MEEGQEFFLVYLAFFTKMFSRCALSSSSFDQTFLYLGKLLNTQTKGITLLSIGINNIYISCVVNGFKYIFSSWYVFYNSLNFRYI